MEAKELFGGGYGIRNETIYEEVNLYNHKNTTRFIAPVGFTVKNPEKLFIEVYSLSWQEKNSTGTINYEFTPFTVALKELREISFNPNKVGNTNLGYAANKKIELLTDNTVSIWGVGATIYGYIGFRIFELK